MINIVEEDADTTNVASRMTIDASEKSMDKIVALARNRGFVYPVRKFTAAWPMLGITGLWVFSSKQYQNCLVAKFVQESPYNVGVDCAILMNPAVWQASGMLVASAIPSLIAAGANPGIGRTSLIEDYNREAGAEVNVDGWQNEQLAEVSASNAFRVRLRRARLYQRAQV